MTFDNQLESKAKCVFADIHALWLNGFNSINNTIGVLGIVEDKVIFKIAAIDDNTRIKEYREAVKDIAYLYINEYLYEELWLQYNPGTEEQEEFLVGNEAIR